MDWVTTASVSVFVSILTEATHDVGQTPLQAPSSKLPLLAISGIHVVHKSVVDAVSREQTCHLCLSRDALVSYRPPYLPDLWGCSACSGQFVDPQPTDDELERVYQQDYFDSFGYSNNAAGFHRQKQRHFRQLLSFWELFVTPGRVLDVGSGLGDFLVVAAERGWECVGFERNGAALVGASSAVRCATRIGLFETLVDPDDPFDLVTFHDTLEHLRDPRESLLRAFGCLRPGGCVAISTVDVGSVAARWLGWRWPHYHRDHLWYFSRQSLVRLVEKAGFVVEDGRVPRKVFALDYVLAILATYSNDGMIRRGAQCLRRNLPNWVLSRSLPAPREGQLLVGRRPADEGGARCHVTQ